MKILIPILLSMAGLLHPAHFSILTVDYREDKKLLDCRLKCFRTDMEGLAFHMFGDRLHEQAIEDTIESETFLSWYLPTMIQFIINEKDTGNIRSIRLEKDPENYWISFYVPLEKKARRVDITNYFLMDFYSEQTNLVIFNKGKEEDGYSLDADNPTAIINIIPKGKKHSPATP